MRPKKKDPAAFDRLLDQVFAEDKRHPFLGQTVEPDTEELEPIPSPARGPVTQTDPNSQT